MPPLKLFISYRSLDSAKVDAIVSRLASLKNEDGTSLYIPWQDKTGIPGAKDWWEAIVDAIIDCDVFVFNISQEALKSDVCRAELSYARRRNRPIIPVVLEGEFFMNQKTRKPDITYWQDIPGELNDLRAQFLFYDGAPFFQGFDRAVAEFIRVPQKWRDIPASRPGDPRQGSETTHDGITLYDEACDYAGRMEFTTAEKLFQKLVNRNDPDFGAVAFEWIELLRQYERVLALDAKASTRFRVRSAWDEYQKLFPKDFLESIFDPKAFEARFAAQIVAPVPPLSPRLPHSRDLMPPPFDWIEIPVGETTLEKGGYILKGGQTFHVPEFTIAKYPVTNAQFARFINADGYGQRRWWTDFGWEEREKGWIWDVETEEWRITGKAWTAPRFWQYKNWRGEDYPVVGVSWYEALAFCRWLAEETGEQVILPTEQQWQRAAQGEDNRMYPWGNEWDTTCCNNLDSGPKKTTPVNHYERKGFSPYGVIDMVGNVWEWCMTIYANGSHDMNAVADTRVLRGGAWHNKSIALSCLFRTGGTANNGVNGVGFRCARL